LVDDFDVFGLWSLQNLLGAGVLGHTLGTLRYSMFCQLSWENKPCNSLNRFLNDMLDKMAQEASWGEK